MGYTHYWYREPRLSPGAFRAFVRDCAAIFTAAQDQGIKLAGPAGTGWPIASLEKGVCFNGEGPESYESFILQRVESQVSWQDDDPLVFTFCKTEHRPYDAVVTAVLLAAHAKLGVVITSDGRATDWAEGRELYRKALGLEPPTDEALATILAEGRNR